jgi:chromosomal replication initiation ATPase DnaA
LVSQLVLPLETKPALGREDFIVSGGNRDAVMFIDAWPDWPAHAAALFGPSGSGKSHLVSIWAARANARIVEAANLDDAILGEGGAIAVENVDTAVLGDSAERVLFALFERRAPMLFTGREAPSQWSASLPDLLSRYRALLAFGLWAPDDALLEAVARKLFQDRQLNVPDAVIAQMLRSLERSPAAIRDFVARADEKALSDKRPVTAGLIRELLVESSL